MKSRIKNKFEEITGLRIFRRLPEGVSVCRDIQTHLSARPIEVIFDVGANVGQSAELYLKEFRQGQVYCFEPGSANFRALSEKFRSHKRVQCHEIALGATSEKRKLSLQDYNSSHLVSENDDEDHQRTEDVQVETVDDFCRRHSISKISLMKVDTEGHDLEVLKGAEQMLEKMNIDLVQVEASMNRENEKHVAFEEFRDYFRSRGYFLFRIYEQVPEIFFNNEPHLRRSNPVFASRRVIDENRTP